MTLAATLPEAAGLAQQNLFPLWLADSLKTDVTAFAAALNASGLFQNQMPNDHPMINWTSVISALGTRLPATAVSYLQLDEAIDYVFRICWMANTTLYSTAQKTAVLAAYNAAFG